MIKEDYLSYKVAKQLAESGFDGYCDWYYPKDGGNITELSLDEMYYRLDNYIKAPTLQMAMKWLRDVHHIFISVSANPIRIVEGRIEQWLFIAGAVYTDERYDTTRKIFIVDGITYETAVENAIEMAVVYYLES